ncbi:MAG: domain containing protein [Verrucomicrobiales bacterium]|nr:domain containing protein [Verrucomicrobiales bacterium]
MVQLHISSGLKAGSRVVARHFPFKVGRGPKNDLVSHEPGVWEEHCSLTLDKEGVQLHAVGAALISVNQMAVKDHRLKNGDMIALGGLKIIFSLSPTIQSGLWLREAFTWALLITITASQVALIYWLLLNV